MSFAPLEPRPRARSSLDNNRSAVTSASHRRTIAELSRMKCRNMSDAETVEQQHHHTSSGLGLQGRVTPSSGGAWHTPPTHALSAPIRGAEQGDELEHHRLLQEAVWASQQTSGMLGTGITSITSTSSATNHTKSGTTPRRLRLLTEEEIEEQQWTRRLNGGYQRTTAPTTLPMNEELGLLQELPDRSSRNAEQRHPVVVNPSTALPSSNGSMGHNNNNNMQALPSSSVSSSHPQYVAQTQMLFPPPPQQQQQQQEAPHSFHSTAASSTTATTSLQEMWDVLRQQRLRATTTSAAGEDRKRARDALYEAVLHNDETPMHHHHPQQHALASTVPVARGYHPHPQQQQPSLSQPRVFEGPDISLASRTSVLTDHTTDELSSSLPHRAPVGGGGAVSSHGKRPSGSVSPDAQQRDPLSSSCDAIMIGHRSRPNQRPPTPHMSSLLARRDAMLRQRSDVESTAHDVTAVVVEKENGATKGPSSTTAEEGREGEGQPLSVPSITNSDGGVPVATTSNRTPQGRGLAPLTKPTATGAAHVLCLDLPTAATTGGGKGNNSGSSSNNAPRTSAPHIAQRQTRNNNNKTGEGNKGGTRRSSTVSPPPPPLTTTAGPVGVSVPSATLNTKTTAVVDLSVAERLRLQQEQSTHLAQHRTEIDAFTALREACAWDTNGNAHHHHNTKRRQSSARSKLGGVVANARSTATSPPIESEMVLPSSSSKGKAHADDTIQGNPQHGATNSHHSNGLLHPTSNAPSILALSRVELVIPPSVAPPSSSGVSPFSSQLGSSDEQGIKSPLPSARPLSGRPALGVPAPSATTSLLSGGDEASKHRYLTGGSLRHSSTVSSSSNERADPALAFACSPPTPHQEWACGERPGGVPFAVVSLPAAGRLSLTQPRMVANIPNLLSKQQQQQQQQQQVLGEEVGAAFGDRALSASAMREEERESAAGGSMTMTTATSLPQQGSRAEKEEEQEEQEEAALSYVSIPHAVSSHSAQPSAQPSPKAALSGTPTVAPTEGARLQSSSSLSSSSDDAVLELQRLLVLQRSKQQQQQNRSSPSSLNLGNPLPSLPPGRALQEDDVRTMLLKELVQQEARRGVPTTTSATTAALPTMPGAAAENGEQQQGKLPYYLVAELLDAAQSKRITQRCQSLRELRSPPPTHPHSSSNATAPRDDHGDVQGNASLLLGGPISERNGSSLPSLESQPNNAAATTTSVASTAAPRRRQSVTLLLDDDDDGKNNGEKGKGTVTVDSAAVFAPTPLRQASSRESVAESESPEGMAPSSTGLYIPALRLNSHEMDLTSPMDGSLPLPEQGDEDMQHTGGEPSFSFPQDNASSAKAPKENVDAASVCCEVERRTSAPFADAEPNDSAIRNTSVAEEECETSNPLPSTVVNDTGEFFDGRRKSVGPTSSSSLAHNNNNNKNNTFNNLSQPLLDTVTYRTPLHLKQEEESHDDGFFGFLVTAPTVCLSPTHFDEGGRVDTPPPSLQQQQPQPGGGGGAPPPFSAGTSPLDEGLITITAAASTDSPPTPSTAAAAATPSSRKTVTLLSRSQNNNNNNEQRDAEGREGGKSPRRQSQLSSSTRPRSPSALGISKSPNVANNNISSSSTTGGTAKRPSSGPSTQRLGMAQSVRGSVSPGRLSLTPRGADDALGTSLRSPRLSSAAAAGGASPNNVNETLKTPRKSVSGGGGATPRSPRVSVSPTPAAAAGPSRTGTPPTASVQSSGLGASLKQTSGGGGGGAKSPRATQKGGKKAKGNDANSNAAKKKNASPSVVADDDGTVHELVSDSDDDVVDDGQPLVRLQSVRNPLLLAAQGVPLTNPTVGIVTPLAAPNDDSKTEVGDLSIMSPTSATSSTTPSLTTTVTFQEPTAGGSSSSSQHRGGGGGGRSPMRGSITSMSGGGSRRQSRAVVRQNITSWSQLIRAEIASINSNNNNNANGGKAVSPTQPSSMSASASTSAIQPNFAAGGGSASGGGGIVDLLSLSLQDDSIGDSSSLTPTNQQNLKSKSGGSRAPLTLADQSVRVAIVISIGEYKDKRISADGQCDVEADRVAKLFLGMGYTVTRMSMREEDPMFRPTSKQVITQCITNATTKCKFAGGQDLAFAMGRQLTPSEVLNSCISLVYVCGGGYLGQVSGIASNVGYGSKSTLFEYLGANASFTVVPSEVSLNELGPSTLLQIADLEETGFNLNNMGKSMRGTGEPIVGPKNIVLVDTYSISFLPPCNPKLNGFCLSGGRKTIGGELFALYELKHRFTASLYYQRALSGWATRDSRVSSNGVTSFIHTHLVSHQMYATTNSSPFFVGDVDIAAVANLRFSRLDIREIRTVLHDTFVKLDLTLIPLKNQDPSSFEFLRTLRNQLLAVGKTDTDDPLLVCLSREYSNQVSLWMRGIQPHKILGNDAAVFSHVLAAKRFLMENLKDPYVDYHVSCSGSLLFGVLTMTNVYTRDEFLLRFENSKRIRAVRELKKEWDQKLKQFDDAAATRAAEQAEHLAQHSSTGAVLTTGNVSVMPSPRASGKDVAMMIERHAILATKPDLSRASGHFRSPLEVQFTIPSGYKAPTQQQQQQETSSSSLDPSMLPPQLPVHELGWGITISFFTTEYMAMRIDRALRYGYLATDYSFRRTKISVMDDRRIQLHLFVSKLQGCVRGYLTRKRLSCLLPLVRQEVELRSKMRRDEHDLLLKINAAHVWGVQRIFAERERQSRIDLITIEGQEYVYFYMDCVSSFQKAWYITFVARVRALEREEAVFRDEIVGRKNLLWPGILDMLYWRKLIRILRDEVKMRLRLQEEGENKARNIASQFWKVDRRKW